MHLQREDAAGLDHDAFDLEAFAGVNAVVGTPGPQHLAVDAAFGATLFFEAVDDLLDVLRLVLVRHQNRIGGFHHHQIAHPDAGHQATLRQCQGVTTILQQHIALGDVTVGVLGQHLPQGVPGANIRPTGAQRNHDTGWQCSLGARCPDLLRNAFHDGVVDRVGRTGGEGLLADPDEVTISRSQRPSAFAGGQNIGPAGRHRRQPDRGAQHEQAAVPEVAALLEVSLRRCQIGFFYKAFDQAGALRRPLVGSA